MAEHFLVACNQIAPLFLSRYPLYADPDSHFSKHDGTNIIYQFSVYLAGHDAKE